jgi:hypothetical protein
LGAGAVVAIAVPVFVAVLGAVVTLIVKRIDIRAAAERTHAESRVEGYEHILTASDACWYWNLRLISGGFSGDEAEMSELLEPWEREVLSIRQRGIDTLKAHSHDFNTVDMAITYIDVITTAILDRDDLTPEHYEQAREVVLDCQRRDTGLEKRLRLGGIKRWPKKLAALRESVRPAPTRVEYLTAKAHAAGLDGVVIVDDGSAIVEWLDRRNKLNEELRSSMERAAARLDEWRSQGRWSQELP